MSLNDLEVGETAIITHITDSPFIVKLYEMGFEKSIPITLMATSWSNDPICVRLGNSKLMLRKREAATIFVSKIKKDNHH